MGRKRLINQSINQAINQKMSGNEGGLTLTPKYWSWMSQALGVLELESPHFPTIMVKIECGIQWLSSWREIFMSRIFGKS